MELLGKFINILEKKKDDDLIDFLKLLSIEQKKNVFFWIKKSS
jgi:hypothetical protein